VITTSLTLAQSSTAEVVEQYQSLPNVEARFRVLKDFLGLRPVFHWTEDRVKGHIAICARGRARSRDRQPTRRS
jgi:transposase